MVKNIALKRFLKKTVFKPMALINKAVPKDEKLIMLYTANKQIGDNLLPIKDYLVSHGYYEQYRIIGCVESKKYIEKSDRHIKYVTKFSGLFFFLRAKYVFYSNGQIPIKPTKKQVVWFVDHGIAFKSYGPMGADINGDNHFFSKFVVPSEIYIPIIEKDFSCKKDDIVVIGEPMTDALYSNTVEYDFGKKYDKLILWTPTFRQSDYLGYDDSTEEILPGVSEDQYEELNTFLSRKNALLIVKLHPCQNVDDSIKKMFSNLRIYTDKKFKDERMDLYKLLRQTDVLLGDYSSVFLQFLHLNRPIGFVIPDYEEYCQKRGFVFEDPLKFMPGKKIYNFNQLLEFINEIDGKDEYVEFRKSVFDQVYKYHDNKSCQRIVSLMGIKLE